MNHDLTVAVERVISALERQIRKHKTKLEKKLRAGVFDNYSPISEDSQPVEEEHEFKIIKTKRVSTKPMMAEEAILQMNLIAHDFFLFNNPDTGSVNIVYKRKDGNYGLIETN